MHKWWVKFYIYYEIPFGQNNQILETNMNTYYLYC